MSLTRTAVRDHVTTVGALLPLDLLQRIATGKDLAGAAPADYRLYGKHETVHDAAERSWAYLRGVWQAYQDELSRQGADEDTSVQATGLTRERWLLPLLEELKFARESVPGGGLSSADGLKRFPVSHRSGAVPLHLLGWNTRLDTRTHGVSAAAPQSMLQEYLNRSGPETLWGVLANGRLLRLLRQSTSLVGAAYVEFDLQGIFAGERFADFLLLYRLVHQSRFAPQGEPEAPPSTCWLERWRLEAVESGTRALKQLRIGVQHALTTLGTGFLKHPDNREWANTLGTSALSIDELHHALLRAAYRLLFLFVAEDRGVLIPDTVAPAARERFQQYFSSDRLRRTASVRRGDVHSDQWQALRLVLDGLGQEGGVPLLGLPALGGIFEDTADDRPLTGLSLANEDLFAAVRALCVVLDPKLGRRRAVDYRHLGAEELGSVYESLLELIPRHDAEAQTFELHNLPGNERKNTGSYYTPAPLIDCLLDSALDPVLDRAVKSGRTPALREQALLALKICDPACGSGHFLVAAARRLARRLAQVRTDEPEPGLEAMRTALRDVIGHCVYGVDIKPLAVELAKVSLWLEAVEPGKPLNFLDGHVKQGNALLGTTPKLLAGGLPDLAFKAIEGDDSSWVTKLRKRNKTEREVYEDHTKSGSVNLELFAEAPLRIPNTQLAEAAAAITASDSDKLKDVRAQGSRYDELIHRPDFIKARELADAWCAAFVWTKQEKGLPAITTGTLLDMQNNPGDVDARVAAEVVRLQRQYEFFHWHLEFPEVFAVREDDTVSDTATGWTGGFSCVLGNPPWERVKLQEQEFFAALHEGIAKAPNKAARDRRIAALATSEEESERRLLADFLDARRLSEGVSHLLRDSNRFPLTGTGDVNTYSVFAETASLATDTGGRFGLVLPTGIATDATTAPFFSDLVRERRLASLLDFENEAFILSQDVHHSVRFCLLTATGRGERVSEASFAFGTRHMADLPLRRFAMPPEEILLVNPNTGTLPVFRSRRDAEITLGIYRRMPVLLRQDDPVNGNPWDLRFMTMFHMSNDSHLFRTREQLDAEGWELRSNVYSQGGQRMLPLYEAKMLHHYDHRLGTYEGQTQAQANVGTLPRTTPEQHDDSDFAPMPRYWAPEFDTPTEKRDSKGNIVHEPGVTTQLHNKDWFADWLFGWRDICRSTDQRTMINTVLRRTAVPDGTLLMLPGVGNPALLQSALSSFVLDYVARQKFSGTHLKFFTAYQLPAPSPEVGEESCHWSPATVNEWITPRVLELTYTAHDMAPFAADLGDSGAPFRWDASRRAVIRAELDAAFFLLYGVTREDVDYIMDTFPVIKKREETEYNGEYRTKELILRIYDALAEATASGIPFRTQLDPQPGFGPRHASR